MLTGKLLENLFKKAGIDVTNADLAPIFALTQEVPEDTATNVEKALLSVEAAKTNPAVEKVIRQKILGSADLRMNDLITELELTMGQDFADEKNTYEKISLLVNTALAHGKNIGTKNPKGSEDWIKEKGEYERQLKELKTSFGEKEKGFEAARKSDLTNFQLREKLLNKNYVFDKDMDSTIKVSSALAAINKELAAKGYKIVLNEAGDDLIVVDKDGAPAHSDKHEPIQANNFIDGALAQHKLLRVNGDGGGGNNGRQPEGHIPADASVAQKNAGVIAEIEAQVAAM